MLKNSPNKKTYHDSYSEPVWYRDKPTFPNGRNPNADLFNDEVIKSICKIVDPFDGADLKALQQGLRKVAFNFMTVLYTTPLRLSEGPEDIKLSARIKHLEVHVIKPVTQLLDALSDDNLALLSEWPEELDYPEPDKSSLVTELSKLNSRTSELKLLLKDRLPNETMTKEFLTDLGNALTGVLKSFFPNLTVSRGTHHKTDVPGESSMNGVFLSVMEICVGEILPNDKKMSNKLIGELRKLQGP